MRGLIIHAHGEGSHEAERPGQQPLFYVREEPVFEVWFWDKAARLWFVMTTDPTRVPAGAVSFHPLTARQQLAQLRDQWRAYRAAGGHEPGNTPRV